MKDKNKSTEKLKIVGDTDADKIETLTQIIEDLYVNYKIGTLDTYMKRTYRVKEITDIIYDKNREKNKDLDFLK